MTDVPEPPRVADARGPVISLIVPVHDEEAAIAPFLDSVGAALEGHDLEVVFVNDGSRDGTEREIERLLANDDRIRLVNLSRNFGKEAALAAGLEHASGDVMVPMDIDLQDPPEVIPRMLERWAEGARIVNARRIDRSADGWLKRVTAGGFYRVFNLVADHPIPRDVGDFRLLDRDVVDAIREFGERGRFNKGIFGWVGFETAEVCYVRPGRVNGQSSWSYWRLWKLALDGIFSSSTAPLRIWTYIGVTMALFAFLYAFFILLATLAGGRDVPGYASTVILILTFGGLNMIALGIIGEYVGRIYTEVRQRPLYIVRSVRRGGAQEGTDGA